MKLEINHRKRSEKKPTTWRLNMLLKNQWVNEEIKKEMKKYLETNDNEDTTSQNLWEATEAGFRGTLITIHASSKKKKALKLTTLPTT